MEIVLASTSPYRAQLLQRAGLRFTSEPPGVDEEELKRAGPEAPKDLCRHLARAKAESLREKYPQHVIIGCDQMAHLQGEVLGKPGTREKAIHQLLLMQEKEHELLTALCVLAPGSVHEHLDLTKIRIRSLSSEEAAAYVDLDRPFNCAGGYKIEGAGIRLVKEMHCEDFTAIIGLPMIALSEILRKIGLGRF